MALKDLLKTPPRVQVGVKSRVDIWREALNADDQKAFDTAVRNPEWPTSALWRIAVADGLDIKDAAFRSWRAAAAKRDA